MAGCTPAHPASHERVCCLSVRETGRHGHALWAGWPAGCAGQPRGHGAPSAPSVSVSIRFGSLSRTRSLTDQLTHRRREINVNTGAVLILLLVGLLIQVGVIALAVSMGTQTIRRDLDEAKRALIQLAGGPERIARN
jgi:hypothetical protein